MKCLGLFYMASFLLTGYVIADSTTTDYALPQDISKWKEMGVVLKYGTGWESKMTGDFRPEGIVKKEDKYYLYYGAGFNGCWQVHDAVSHKSIGLATSADGVNFTKLPQNPILKPHDFVPVSSHEEGIRGAIIKYVPDLNKFLGYFGVEDPGGVQTCGFMSPEGGGCGCDNNNPCLQFSISFIGSSNEKANQY